MFLYLDVKGRYEPRIAVNLIHVVQVEQAATDSDEGKVLLSTGEFFQIKNCKDVLTMLQIAAEREGCGSERVVSAINNLRYSHCDRW